MDYIEETNRRHNNDMITVVLPGFIALRWWHNLLRNQTSLLLKGALLFRKNTVVTSVPYRLEH